MALLLCFKRLLSPNIGLALGSAVLAAVFVPLFAFAEVSIGPSGVSLSPTGNQYTGTPYKVSGSIRNSGSDDYTGTVYYMWYYSTNGGTSWSDWSGLQWFTGLDGKDRVDVGRSGTVGSPDGSTYSFRLCVNTSPFAGSGCSSAGSITPTAQVRLHTLSVSKSGLGTVTGSGISCGSDCAETYTEGTSVSLSALPDSGNGYAFSGWSGDCSGSFCFLSMNSGKSVTANFIKVYNISASAGSGGSVSCSGCGSSVPSGASVKATATATDGYRFSGWSGLGSGCLSGSTSCSITAGSSGSITANFTRITYTLSTSVASGSGTVSGGGSYSSGSSVTVTANPGSGYEFSSWGGACSGTLSPCSLTMNSDKSVSANFSSIMHFLSVGKTGSGTVTGSGINCGINCGEYYAQGTSVTLSATPGDGYRISGWSGCASSSGSSCSVSMSAPRSVTASFERITYPLSISATGSGSGSVSCNGGSCASSYPSGTTVRLTAEPSGNSVFGGWSDGCSGGASSCTVSMTQARSITALFAPVVSSGGGSAFVKEEHWGVFATVRGPNRCDSPYLNGICDKIAPVITSLDANRSYAPGESFRVTGSSGFIKGYTNEVGLSLSYPGFSQSGIVQFGPYRPRSKTIDFDFGPFILPSQPGTYQIRMTISFLFGANGRLEWFSGYLPVTVALPTLPNLTANAPTLSDQYGNSGSPLGAGRITIKGVINNNGTASTANGSFSNQYQYRPSGGTWNPLKDIALQDVSRSVGAGELNRAVASHSWTGGVGTWEFQLVADSADAVPESNETIADNASKPTRVEIVDFTPTLTPNRATAFVGDTISFTADSTLHGALQDKTKVSYASFKCDTRGAPAPKALSATSFSCTYTTPGPKTASVSATYYRIPKSATAPVTITPEPKPGQPSVSAAPSYCGGNIKLSYQNSASGATSYELWRQPTQTGSAWGKLETKDAATLLRALDHLTPSAAYSYKVVAVGAGGSTDSLVSSALASPPCQVSLLVRPAGSAASAGDTLSLAYNSPADLLWTTANPPPRPQCNPTPSSVSLEFSGDLPPTGEARTASLPTSQTFTITCKDRDYPEDTPWSDSVRVTVFAYKPHVELYISPVGQPCMTRKQKTTVILKGQPTTLCWKVTAEEVTP